MEGEVAIVVECPVVENRTGEVGGGMQELGLGPEVPVV